MLSSAILSSLFLAVMTVKATPVVRALTVQEPESGHPVCNDGNWDCGVDNYSQWLCKGGKWVWDNNCGSPNAEGDLTAPFDYCMRTDLVEGRPRYRTPDGLHDAVYCVSTYPQPTVTATVAPAGAPAPPPVIATVTSYTYTTITPS